jgi:purine-binding chemotaxis protein CheW
MDRQVVVFEVGGVACAVAVAEVERVVEAAAVDPVPALEPPAPAFLVGVLRGLRPRERLPVLDLRERLGLAPSAASGARRVLVVEVAGAPAGVIVDAVARVQSVPEADIVPPPALVVTEATAFLQAVARVAGSDRLLLVLDLHRLLSDEDQAALRVAAAALRA